MEDVYTQLSEMIETSLEDVYLEGELTAEDAYMMEALKEAMEKISEIGNEGITDEELKSRLEIIVKNAVKEVNKY